MKTQNNISKISKLGITVLASLALVNVTMKAADAESAAINRIDSFARVFGADLKYYAPVIDADVEFATESLNSFAETTQVSMKYVAADYAEADARAEEIASALENLETIAASFETGLKYQAPSEDAAVEVVPAVEKLEMLADSTLSALRYQAPVCAENGVYDVTENTSNDMLAQIK